MTLIDNIYIFTRLQKNFKSSILVSDISDHLPTLALLKKTKHIVKDPLHLKSRKLNDSNIEKIKEKKLNDLNWQNILDERLRTDKLYKTFSGTLKQIMDKVAPERDIIISSKNRLVEPGMTARMKQASSPKLRVYKDILKQNSTDNHLNKYKAFRNKYNRPKHHAMLT